MLGLLVPLWLRATYRCPSQNTRKKSTSSQELMCCHSPLTTHQDPGDTYGHPTFFFVDFIWKSWHDLRSCIKKTLVWSEITRHIHRYFIALSKIFFFASLRGCKLYRGHVRGVFHLSLHYLKRLNHAEAGKGMKFRSSFDMSEKHRLCNCTQVEERATCQEPGKLSSVQKHQRVNDESSWGFYIWSDAK